MFINNFYNKTLSLIFYHVGDFFSKFEWSFSLYQKCMKISYYYDEKNGFTLWKEPSEL